MFQSSEVMPLIPEFLLSSDKELISHKETCEKKIKGILDYVDTHDEMSQMNKYCSEQKMKKQHKCQKLTQQIKELNEKLIRERNREKKLEVQISSIKNQVIDETANSSTGEDLLNLIEKLTLLKQRIDKEKKESVTTLQQYKKGIFFYKKYLHCNVICLPENQVIFTPNICATMERDVVEFLKFTTDDAQTFHYVEMRPKLEVEEELVQRFKETGDVQGFVLSFLKAVRLLKRNRISKD